MPPNMPPDDHESIDGCGRAQCATEDSALQALDRRRPLSGGDAERRQVLADEVPPRWSREAPGHRCVSGDLAEAGAGRARDRKSVVLGKSVSVRVDLGGRRIIKKTIDATP